MTSEILKFFIWLYIFHSICQVNGQSEIVYSQASSLPSDLNCTCVRNYQCDQKDVVSDPDEAASAEERVIITADAFSVSPPKCGPFYVCCRFPLPFEEGQKRFQHQGCGIRNHHGILPHQQATKDIGQTKLGEYPWLAVLRDESVENPRLDCLGALISKRHVLTRAHCAYRLSEFIEIGSRFYVRFGEWSRGTQTENLPYEDILVRRVFLHPHYNPENSIFDYNDIAIVELERDVVFKPHIDTVCLPEEGKNDVTEGETCIATTWTWHPQSYPTDGSLRPTILQEHDITIFPEGDCQARYDDWVRGHGSRKINESIICGIEKNQKSCFYDLAIPLVCYRPEDGRYQVVGISSSYINCYSGTKVPLFFMRVKTFLNWIKKIISN